MSSQLVSLYELRSVEGHDAGIQFGTHIVDIATALKRIQSWKDLNSASIAVTLLNSIRQGEFILAVLCLNTILKYTLPISKQLQSGSIDMVMASGATTDTVTLLKEG